MPASSRSEAAPQRVLMTALLISFAFTLLAASPAQAHNRHLDAPKFFLSFSPKGADLTVEDFVVARL